MRYFIFALAGLLWFICAAPPANAVVCAVGVYRAGCVSARGAVVVRRPVARCYWRAGVRVCRW